VNAPRQIVLDTETTGLDVAQDHRIIEIGCVEVRNRRVIGEKHWYLNPDRDSDPGAFQVHGLTREFLSTKQRFPEIAAELTEYLQGAEFLIHNASFDATFLDYEFRRAGLSTTLASLGTITDTLVMARQKHPGQKNGLDALCKRYEVDNSHRELHGALLDARLLADVYLGMTGGQETLLLASDESKDHGLTPELRALFARAEGLPLTLRPADEIEIEAHLTRLAAIEEKSGKRLWPESV